MITKYKKAALDRLQGRWWTEIGYISIYFCIILLSEILIDETRFIFKLIVSIIANVIYLGYTKHVLDMFNGKEKSSLEDILVYFTSTEIIFIFGLNILVFIFTFLWSLLFIIPGIVASISYMYSLYIKMENPDVSALDAIKMSKEITRGHKGEIFLLSLSFIGWILLGIITIVGIIPVIVYMTFSMIEQYKYLSIRSEGVGVCETLEG